MRDLGLLHLPQMNIPDDPQLLELLDDYLSQLQAGKRPDREALLREHPELATSLKCLEALEGLAGRGNAELDLDPPAWKTRGFPAISAPTSSWKKSAGAAWAWSTRRGKRPSTAPWPSR